MSSLQSYTVTVFFLLSATVLLCLYRYGGMDLVLDTSTDAAFHESVIRIGYSLNDSRRPEFTEAVKLVTYSDLDLVRVLSGIGLHVQANIGRRKLNGLTAIQAIELAECIRNERSACAEPTFGYAN